MRVGLVPKPTEHTIGVYEIWLLGHMNSDVMSIDFSLVASILKKNGIGIDLQELWQFKNYGMMDKFQF